MPGDFPIALHGVHITNINAAARNAHRRNENCPGPDPVNIHMPVRNVFQLVRRNAVFVGRSHQELAKVPGVVGIGGIPYRRSPQLPQEGTQPRHHAGQVVGSQCNHRVLDGMIWRLHEVFGVPGRFFRTGLIQCNAYFIVIFKGNGIAAGKSKGGYRGAAFFTFYGVLSDSLHIGFRIQCPALGAFPRYKRIPQAAVGKHAVVAGRSAFRCNFDRNNFNGNGIAGFRPFHQNRLGHFVAAPDGRRQHRSPASGRRIGNNVAAVFHRPQHGHVRTQNPIGKLIHKNCLLCHW